MRTLACMTATMTLLGVSLANPLQGTLRADSVDYTKSVLPILEKKCFACHGEKKGKAKLRLHNSAAIGGGKSKKAIVAGKPDESLLIARVSLARDHDDVMPPEDEGDAVTAAEIEILKKWIQEGAKYPAGATVVVKVKPKGEPLTEADEKKLAEIRKTGARAMRLAQDVNWIAVSFRPAADNTGDEQVRLVQGLANIAELNLAGSKVTDGGLEAVASLKNLSRLHLERTAVKGSGLSHLKGLSQLEYLNLYGTEIDDAALKNLEGLKSLKKLYLWQTKVTDAGVDSLKKAIPGVYVNRGIDPPAKAHPEPDAPKVADKKPEAGKPEPKKPEAKKVGKVVIAASSDGWKYMAKTSVKGKGWLEEAFDDSKWTAGKTPLGYGEGVIAEKKGTTIDLKGQSILLRKFFEVDEATLKAAKGLRLLVASDDSAIVAVNGKEVDRDTANHEVKYWNRTVELPANALKKGKNVIAVQINNGKGSSDAILDLQLETLTN